MATCLSTALLDFGEYMELLQFLGFFLLLAAFRGSDLCQIKGGSSHVMDFGSKIPALALTPGGYFVTGVLSSSHEAEGWKRSSPTFLTSQFPYMGGVKYGGSIA